MSTSIRSIPPVILLLCAFVTSCGSAGTFTPIPPGFPGDNPYAPQAGDAAMQRGEVRIVSSSLDTTSLPGQAILKFDYFLPTPCHLLRVEVGRADANHRIDVTAYSLIQMNKVCTLMGLATPQHASLTLVTYPAGTYHLWLNGTAVSDWTIP